MLEAKRLQYSLILYDGRFDNDTFGGVDSTTAFVPLNVGDFIDPYLTTCAQLPKVDLSPGEAYRVTAVKHSFQDLSSHITQYTHVCLEVADEVR